MAELHTSPAAVSSFRALPDDSWLVLDQHPDKPRFLLSTDPIDDFLIMELMVARRQAIPFDEQMNLIYELLAKAFAPGEWDRFKQAMREVPVVVVAEDGTRTPMNKQAIINSIYQELFPLYTERPTQPSGT